MTAGLLICDHVNMEVRPKFGDYDKMFEQLFPEFDWKYFDVINGQFPENLSECEVYFATGSRHSVYENLDWIVKVKEIIQEIYNQKKYFVGFCFGHQLLGAAMGGKVAKSPNGWLLGVHQFKIEQTKKWIQPPRNFLNLLMMCQDQILELPPKAERLAGNSKCPIGIIQIGEQMLGIQAHPEFSKEYDQYLMEIRRDRIDATIIEDALESLKNLEVYRNVIRQWVLNFLNYK